MLYPAGVAVLRRQEGAGHGVEEPVHGAARHPVELSGRRRGGGLCDTIYGQTGS